MRGAAHESNLRAAFILQATVDVQPKTPQSLSYCSFVAWRFRLNASTRSPETQKIKHDIQLCDLEYIFVGERPFLPMYVAGREKKHMRISPSRNAPLPRGTELEHAFIGQCTNNERVSRYYF
jgi:hypothetical protein